MGRFSHERPAVQCKLEVSWRDLTHPCRTCQPLCARPACELWQHRSVQDGIGLPWRLQHGSLHCLGPVQQPLQGTAGEGVVPCRKNGLV